MNPIKMWAFFVCTAIATTIVVVTIMDHAKAGAALKGDATSVRPAEPKVEEGRPARIARVIPTPAVLASDAGLQLPNKPRMAPPDNTMPGAVPAQDVRDFLHAEIQRQPVDAAWAKTASRRAKEVIDPFLGDQSVIQSVDCRSTACEVVIAHDTEEDFSNFLGKTFLSRAFKWSGEWVTTRMEPPASGKDLMVLFLSKEGTSLPQLEPGPH